jgi:hypothetical protein
MARPEAADSDRVRVALQYEPTLDEPSREQRALLLRQRFKDAVEGSGSDITLDDDSLSVSGQVIEGTVPSHNVRTIADRLGAHGVRMDLVRTLHFS